MSLPSGNIVKLGVAIDKHYRTGVLSQILFESLLNAGYSLGEIAETAHKMRVFVADQRPGDITG